MAKGPAASKKKSAKKDAEAETKESAAVPGSGLDASGALNMAPLGVLRAGPVPAVLPDDQYPEWLWTIDEPGLTITDLRKRDFNTLTDVERRRLLKLTNRMIIKKRGGQKG